MGHIQVGELEAKMIFKNQIKDMKCLENILWNLDYQGFMGSIWSFEIAFPLKLFKHLHCKVYRFLLAF